MLTYTELKRKEVVSVCDGKKLGSVCDLHLSDDGRILALVVPSPFSLQTLFKSDGLVIPWNAVSVIGDDVILVNVGKQALACPT